MYDKINGITTTLTTVAIPAIGLIDLKARRLVGVERTGGEAGLVHLQETCERDFFGFYNITCSECDLLLFWMG